MYALSQLQVCELRIWNRTPSKAQTLAETFHATVMPSIADCLNSDDENVVFLVVGTVPHEAQVSLDLTLWLQSKV